MFKLSKILTKEIIIGQITCCDSSNFDENAFLNLDTKNYNINEKKYLQLIYSLYKKGETINAENIFKHGNKDFLLSYISYTNIYDKSISQ